MRENPFRFCGAWHWSDEKDLVRGPYETQHEALRALLKHVSPTRWERVWRKMTELVRA